MAKINSSKRVTRGIHLFDDLLNEIPSFNLGITQIQGNFLGSITALENERRSKKANDLILLNLTDEIESAKSTNRKKNPIPLDIQNSLGKKRKINNVDLDSSEKIGGEQQEAENEDTEEIRFYVVNRLIEAPHMHIYANHNIIQDLKDKLINV
ncbi:uncharacterized protein LOC129881815 [Solanum dulcamara]|uniref:uncharacterized protein LOC129881815 n=1 Tax=Solanum dulcamara TaxID=45834 RepID=UPI002486464B|nr:uncharacterized protein LOC129881815 [Solanum dulcamara]